MKRSPDDGLPDRDGPLAHLSCGEAIAERLRPLLEPGAGKRWDMGMKRKFPSSWTASWKDRTPRGRCRVARRRGGRRYGGPTT